MQRSGRLTHGAICSLHVDAVYFALQIAERMDAIICENCTNFQHVCALAVTKFTAMFFRSSTDCSP
jgi:hypothetical protein